jgi:hypothetical protein
MTIAKVSVTSLFLIVVLLMAIPICQNIQKLSNISLATVSNESVITESLHADWHSEAQTIRDTCKNKGVWQIFIEPDRETFHLLCNLKSGKIGDRIVKIEADKKTKILAQGDKFEKTAFIPKDGTWKTVSEWLSRKGATKYTEIIKGIKMETAK